MNNQQEAAPRLDDLVLDPQYRGFFPIPNTDILVKLNAKPRVDMMQDNRNSGNADRFVTATIPIEGSDSYDGGSRFNATTKGSSLSAEIRAPNNPGNPPSIDAKMKAQNYLDLAASWAVTKQFTLRGGVNNIFDQDAPLSSQVGTTGNGNTYPQTYDAFGRKVFVSASYKF